MVGLAVLGFLSGCLSPFPPQLGKDEPVFRPEKFFAGHTRGEGSLVTLTGSRRPLRVEGHGFAEPDGSFRLEQRVTFANGKTETRTWRLLERAPGRYTATLSDAAGEVTAEATGNLFHLRYLLRQPWVYVEQQLYLQPDGRTVLNQATVTVIGIPWARLAEEIRKIDRLPPPTASECEGSC